MSDNVINLADWKDCLPPLPLDPHAKLPPEWEQRLADIEERMIAELMAQKRATDSAGH